MAVRFIRLLRCFGDPVAPLGDSSSTREFQFDEPHLILLDIVSRGLSTSDDQVSRPLPCINFEGSMMPYAVVCSSSTAAFASLRCTIDREQETSPSVPNELSACNGLYRHIVQRWICLRWQEEGNHAKRATLRPVGCDWHCGTTWGYGTGRVDIPNRSKLQFSLAVNGSRA